MPKNISGLKRGGQPGRKKGVPNKATIEVKEASRKLVDDPGYRLKLQKRLLEGKLAPAVECMLWHYAHGKPPDRLQVEGELALPNIINHFSEPKADAGA